MKSAIRPIVVLCMLLIVSAVAAAEPGRGRPDQTAQPRRSYGAIDVILYQTSW